MNQFDLRRRAIVAFGMGALAPLSSSSLAQQPPKVWRIGFLGVGSATDMASRVEGFRAGLRDFGYVEGRNVVIEYRWAEGNNDRLPELAAELVRLNVDLILTHGSVAPRTVKRATSTIPIVQAAGGDPVLYGIAASLGHPGGNVTGGTYFSAELVAKRIEILKEINPRVTQVAILVALHEPESTKATMELAVPAAKNLKLGLTSFAVRDPAEFEHTFAAIAKQRVGAIALTEHVILNLNVKTTAALALKHRLLSAGNPEFAKAGGLLGYGVNIPGMFRRSAYFIDRIFKGAKPADLPFERPTKFDFVVNMKTAKALGIKLPGAILVQATRVIE